jgi:hypothetical protein
MEVRFSTDLTKGSSFLLFEKLLQAYLEPLDSTVYNVWHCLDVDSNEHYIISKKFVIIPAVDVQLWTTNLLYSVQMIFDFRSKPSTNRKEKREVLLPTSTNQPIQSSTYMQSINTSNFALSD